MSRGMNFNEDLFVLLKKQMAVHWASTFGSTFNDGMAVYAAGAIEALETFHKAVLDSPELDCAKSANLGVLNDQVNALTQSIRQAESKFKVTVKLKQRVGSRWFVKSIADYMKEIYERCASMHGTCALPFPATHCNRRSPTSTSWYMTRLRSTRLSFVRFLR